ncbi:hypothetical protein HK104_005600 [Borealophlyctis nickersoniae]|nr:hypothetical protein HK104_005600 [Borealophlyctis nickersoniae]
MTAAIKASRTLHEKLLKSVLGAPVRWFETTPVGRVVNRFSKDLGSVDNEVIQTISFFTMMLLSSLLTLLVVAAVTPLFLIVVLPIGLVYYRVAMWYLSCSRELKRLDSVSRSPIYGLFSETLSGCATIRAFGEEERFSRDNEAMIDANHRAHWWLWTANRWLAFRVECIASVAVLCAGAAVLVGNVSAGWAGLSFLYAIEFTEALLWVVRVHAHMEMQMNSVERVKEYMEIEQEEGVDGEVVRVVPPDNWPDQGQITVTDLTVRYTPDSPPVLTNLTFSIPPRGKIGVVGRTGAGKSTLSLALFRILADVTGTITIDGLDISQLRLQDLRSRLTIIPQDPFLFSGTVRDNLDPTGEGFLDADMWSALRRVRFLESLVRGSSSTDLSGDAPPHSVTDSSQDPPPPITLSSPVTENGSNFSQGQRQLLCLARAILRRSKVVVLDEATASVGNTMDEAIQRTLREEFEGCTVVCIAHRLRTVMDYDKILVLDRGQVVEYGTPYELVVREGGWLRRMCEESGEVDALVGIAERSEAERKGK